ncbi:MAG: hypothetical protein KJO40_01200 [Deltaproteobacteria bacterium]|nr:hypothetical protein [Deltaproteobacteria bacterium]NND27984.1 hypothetical protein [Myxococcales bacterium]MBT8465381.1 hypothetical protein [Deltaproteobacteria bacterium]MBT8480311.1 hypothetical protein [Deltaproteobacteria bacterium]NNK07811.1 hypothetical protein [Myxococcales bacterium]
MRVIVMVTASGGTKTRPAETNDRKNEEACALELPQDVVYALRSPRFLSPMSGANCVDQNRERDRR